MKLFISREGLYAAFVAREKEWKLMSRHSWSSIYERELQKLLDQGMEELAATRLAQDNADEIYFELVDRGRNEAKDGERTIGSNRRARQGRDGDPTND